MLKPARRLRSVILAALPALLVAGAFRQARAIAISWNADDLRGVWVMTCPLYTGPAAGDTRLGEFYIQFSMGGASRNNNQDLEVLGGGTYQESSTRSVTGGVLRVTATGFVTTSTAMTLVNSNAQTSSVAIGQGTMDQNKVQVTAMRATDTGYAGTVIGNGSLGEASMTKISDEEVRDGNNAGQACLLSAARP